MTGTERPQTAGQLRFWFLMLILLSFVTALLLQRRHTLTSTAERYYDAGVAAADQGSIAYATADLQAAILADTRFAPGYELLAACYIAQHRDGSAIDVLDRLRTIAPDRPHLYTRIAEAYAGVDRAYLLRWARQAVVQEPRSPRARMMLALGLTLSGDTRDGIAEMTVGEQLASNGRAVFTNERFEDRIPASRVKDLILGQVSSVPY